MRSNHRLLFGRSYIEGGTGEGAHSAHHQPTIFKLRFARPRREEEERTEEEEGGRGSTPSHQHSRRRPRSFWANRQADEGKAAAHL